MATYISMDLWNNGRMVEAENFHSAGSTADKLFS